MPQAPVDYYEALRISSASMICDSRLGCASVIAALVFASVARTALAQDSTPAFEVASVKPIERPDGIREFQIFPGGRLVIHGMSLKDLVRRAYLGFDAAQDDGRVAGGPSWVSSEVFDIVARADGDLGYDTEGRPMRLLAMLRRLLEERFMLKVHDEQRQAPTYDLVMARADRQFGAHLRASRDECHTYKQGEPRPAADRDKACGLQVSAAGGVVHATMRGMTMDDMAKAFSAFRSVSRVVRDGTSLSGRFDADLEYTAATTVTPESPATDARPGVFTAIEEQLGLKLQPTTAAVTFYVIDSASRPLPD